MARPDQTDQRRKELLPIVAGAFAELGYRRTTTAELARRCKVRENILYRLWTDKKAMFVVSIEYVYQLAAEQWKRLLVETETESSAAERLLDYESSHHGETGLHRIVFAGLSETDDPEIRDALRNMYGRFHRFIRKQLVDYRGDNPSRALPSPDLAAWAIVGLGTVASISQELELLTQRQRKRLIARSGRLLIDGDAG